MEIVIRGHNLPGRMFRNAGVPIHNVHVGIQVRTEPEDLVAGDADAAVWRVDVRVNGSAGDLDFAGPAVQGRRGERFIYLTWGDVGIDDTFAMFRRAKLMFADIDQRLLAEAIDAGRGLTASIDLTDGHGGPLCARVRPPAIEWSLTR